MAVPGVAVRTVAGLATVAAALLATACTTAQDSPTVAEPTGPAGPVVVASTTWVGAFAAAAGATDVKVIAKAGAGYQPDYRPTPAELSAAAGANFVLFAESDGFAADLKAASGKARQVPVTLAIRPDAVKSEVTRLGQLFGTAAAATKWIATFDAETRSLANQLSGVAPIPAPTAVAHQQVADWTSFAGVKLIGEYGPGPVAKDQVAALSAKQPKMLFASAERPADNPTIPKAVRVDLSNFPGDDLDLLAVYLANAQRIGSGFAK